jgi:hypothetical protein
MTDRRNNARTQGGGCEKETWSCDDNDDGCVAFDLVGGPPGALLRVNCVGPGLRMNDVCRDRAAESKLNISKSVISVTAVLSVTMMLCLLCCCDDEM